MSIIKEAFDEAERRKIMDKMRDEQRSDLDKFMLETMKKDYTEKARTEGTVGLTSEHLREVAARLKREGGHFVVIDANFLPDDCYGIIYLRPEDAAKLRAKKEKP